MNNVIEYASFKLVEGVNIESFLEASKQFQTEFVEKQKGMISRKLVQENELWADVVEWVSMDDALLCENNMGGNPVVGAYMSCISYETVVVHHFTIRS